MILVGCWPRRMCAELAATYCGERSSDAFLKRVGKECPQPRVNDGRRRLPNRGERFVDGCFAAMSLNADGVGTIETATRDSAVIASLAPQHGVPVRTIRRALTRNNNGAASGSVGHVLDLLAVELT
jgi:hypothetical protein